MADINALNNLGGASSGTSGAAKTAQSAQGIAKTFDNFLTLLTTQLKNQDPLSPMDSTEFTSQLVQFSMVEQQINGNSKLDALVEAQKANQIVGAAGYIDRVVEVSGDDIILNKVDSSTLKGEFAVALPKDATFATVNIRDSEGRLVRTLEINGETGRVEMSWDGKDNNGNKMEPGAYTVSVTAKDVDGKSVDAATSTIAKVIGVKAIEGVASFEFEHDVTAPLTNMISVRKTATT